MPVEKKKQGDKWAIVEVDSGKVVGHSTSETVVDQAVRIRNMAHAAKQGDKDAQEGMRRLRAHQRGK